MLFKSLIWKDYKPFDGSVYSVESIKVFGKTLSVSYTILCEESSSEINWVAYITSNFGVKVKEKSFNEKEKAIKYLEDLRNDMLIDVSNFVDSLDK